MRSAFDGKVDPQRRALVSAMAIGPAAAVVSPLALQAGQHEEPNRAWVPDQDTLDRLPDWMSAFGVPALGIAVMEGARVSFTMTRGPSIPVSMTARPTDLVFECASLSKPVFACLVLRLVDAGELSLATPLVHYLRPDYLASDDPRLERITVLDVLRHTSGLPNWREQPDNTPLRTVAEPGREIRYSGEAFFWLQLIVESVRNAGLERIAQREIFTPAGMHGSTYSWNAHAAAHSVAGVPAPGETAPVQTFGAQWPLLQRIAEQQGKPLADWRWSDAVAALPQARREAPAGMFVWAGDLMANSAASLRGPVADYARFLAYAITDVEHGGALRSATRDAMLSPQFPVRPGWLDKGLGWNLETVSPDRRWCWHGGANAGRYKAFVVCDPLHRRGIVVMTASGGGTGVYQRIVRRACGRDLFAFDL